MKKKMNSSGKLGWESLLHSDAPAGCALHAALFTTYDRADERLLVENLLPMLLKLDHEPTGEGAERSYFLIELDDRLKILHDRIVVVSSNLREEASGEEPSGRDGMYGWIWRSIRHLTVGRHNKAVQHAKLWLLHWSKDGDEYIEIVVSSANLTSSAFKQQIQAVWRVCIKLQPKSSQTRLSNWGVLPHFMRELAASAGDDSRLDSFVELLTRAECPQGITFVASVPGKHTRQELRRKPWGAAGLRGIIPAGRGVVSASVLSPFVGSWSKDALHRWCANFEGSPNRVSLVWIDKNHPWARNWLLPATTLSALLDAGTTLRQLCYEPNDNKQTDHFHDEHKTTDDRWSHAKVYAFKRGNSRRLLLTSANFSKAAWGDEGRNGELSIENFELGVCIEQVDWPFDHLHEFADSQNAATSAVTLRRSSAFISWAKATWNGKKIVVECKSERDLTGQIFGNEEPLPITKWVKSADGLRTAQVRWVEAKRPPLSVLLTCESEERNEAVIDERKLEERENSFPPEVDEAVVQAMRDELLFERYGGRVAADDEPQAGLITDDEDQIVDTEWEENVEGQTGRSDSYAVDTFVSARLHLQVVDNWAKLVKGASQEFVLEVLQRDGGLLMEAFKRKAERNGKDAMGARLAAEELALRLKHFPKE